MAMKVKTQGDDTQGPTSRGADASLQRLAVHSKLPFLIATVHNYIVIAASCLWVGRSETGLTSRLAVGNG